VSVAISPNTNATPYVIYVATSGNGVFASTDAVTFTSSGPATSLAVASMPMSFSSFASLPASMGQPNGSVQDTANSGATWAPTPGQPAGVIHDFLGVMGVGPLGGSSNTMGEAVVFAGKMNGVMWAPSAPFGTGVATSLAFGGPAIPCTPACTVYAAVSGSAGGVFKSVNEGGNAVTFTSTSFPQTDVLSVATAPSQLSTVYAGTNGLGAGVYVSQNSGASWSPGGSGPANTIVQALAVDPGNPSLVYAGTSGGVFISGDGGGSWKFSGLGATSVTSLAILNGNSSIVFAATSGGLFFTVSGGN
jgi:hypothetical protein